jgi:hypothetical protein
MGRSFTVLFLAVALGSAGCAAVARKPTQPDSAVATAPATPEQIVLGKTRAEAITSRWTDEENRKFVRGASPVLAVRTIGLTPEQRAALGPRVPPDGSAICVLLWNAKEEKVVGTEVYVLTSPPARDQSARFGPHTARYVGSL